jgi:hypothetical protein
MRTVFTSAASQRGIRDRKVDAVNMLHVGRPWVEILSGARSFVFAKTCRRELALSMSLFLLIKPCGSFQWPTNFWNHEHFQGVRQDSSDGVSMVPGGVIKMPVVENSVRRNVHLLTASESANLGSFSLPQKTCYGCYKNTGDSWHHMSRRSNRNLLCYGLWVYSYMLLPLRWSIRQAYAITQKHSKG